MVGKCGRSREECSANERSGKGWVQEDAGQLGSRVGGGEAGNRSERVERPRSGGVGGIRERIVAIVHMYRGLTVREAVS